MQVNVLKAEFFSVLGYGKLRITYNWLYSALNCDPNDNSTFAWNILNAGGGGPYIAYPDIAYNGMQLYASVRDDWDYYVQVQAPGSADWITHAARDEMLGFKILDDLSIVQFSGFNNQLIGVNTSPDYGEIRTAGVDTGTHSGYRVRSIYPTPVKGAFWFMKVISSQNFNFNADAAVSLAAMSPATIADKIQATLQQNGVAISTAELGPLISQIT